MFIDLEQKAAKLGPLPAMNRLSEKLRESIEEEVATGKLGPGIHLDEIELARLLSSAVNFPVIVKISDL